jgi:RND superfamily putative drug exporter
MIVVAALLLTMVASQGAGRVDDQLKEGGWTVPGTGPDVLDRALKSGRFAGLGATMVVLVVQDTQHTAADPEFAARVGGVVNRVAGDEALSVSSWVGYTSGPNVAPMYLGEDQATALTGLGLSLDETEAISVVDTLQGALEEEYSGDGLNVWLVSQTALLGEINNELAESLTQAELIAFPLLLIVLFFLFRSVAAVLVSLMSTVVAILVSMSVVYLITRHVDLSVFTANAVTMLGLGVGVDYSLFIIRRFQTELAQGRDAVAALKVVRATSVRTVLVSGATVIAATSALFFVPLMIIRSIALGIIVAVALSMVVNSIVVPAILEVLGKRIEWLSIARHFKPIDDSVGGTPGGGGGGANFNRAASAVLKRPGTLLLGGAAVILLAASPAGGLATFSPDARIVGEETAVRQGYEAIFEQFGGGLASPIRVMVEAEDGLASLDSAALLELVTEFEAIDGVDSVTSPLATLSMLDQAEPLAAVGGPAVAALPSDVRLALDSQLSADGQAMLIDLRVDDWPSGDLAIDAHAVVEEIAEETDIPGVKISIGGETAFGVVPNREISQSIPRVLAMMLLIIFGLLLIAFRSLLIPVLAVIFNLASVGSTYGIIVLVFQRGWGADLMHFQDLGYIQNFVPVLLLALLVGLATDYQMFLLMRLREEFDKQGDVNLAVGRGLSVTGPIITGAAVLMIVVFTAFAVTGIFPIEQLGFGLAVGVAIDATIVRMFLMPSAIKLMGRWTWWPGRRHRVRLLAADDWYLD